MECSGSGMGTLAIFILFVIRLIGYVLVVSSISF